MIGEFSAAGITSISRSTASTGTPSTAILPPPTTATGLTLDLPNDAYSPTHDYTDRTAGAIAHAAQIPLATISGWVYHDRSDDGIFNTADRSKASAA